MIARSAFVLLAVLVPAAASAQARPQPRPPIRVPPAPEPSPGVRGYALFGSTTLAATDTFDALADTHRRPAFGGGVQVTNLWRRLFVDVAASQLSLDGQRVFIAGGQVFELGIPLHVTMRPIDVAAGWRLRLARGRIHPYGGAGLTYLAYEETSDFAGDGENVDEGRAGPFLLGGVDVQVWRFLSAGVELRWRRVRGLLGEGGVSAEFEERDAGGASVGVRLSVGR